MPHSRPADDPAPTSGWLVGDPRDHPPAAPSGADQRSARLTARLEAYSRYGGLVAEEAAAVVCGDVARAEAIAAERAALTEHYAELRAAAGSGGADPTGFGDLLSDALREADHQSAVDLALRRQLVHVVEGIRALPAPADGPGAADGPGGVAGVVASFAGRLVAARSQGVGGALSGYFPGVGAGAGGAAEPGAGYAADEGGSGEGQRLDVRF